MRNPTKKVAAIAVALLLVALGCIAWWTRLWVLTALPIGFLFGFFLQKGDLCGASAFSEVLLMRDVRKLWGLWVAIVTGAVVFAALDLLGWVQLNPKPFLWASYLVGGILFGFGMVLCGGCISGTLYKAGAGHLNSIVALAGLPLGIAVAEYGALAPFNHWLRQFKFPASQAPALTIPSLLGWPFWLVAVVLAVVTFAIHYRWFRKPPAKRAFWDWLGARNWRPWQAGLPIGLLGGPAYLSSAASGRNYPLGVTHGVLGIAVLAADQPVELVYQPPSPTGVKPHEANGPKAGAELPRKRVNLWLVLLVSSLVPGAWFSAWLADSARLIHKPAEQVLVSLAGSLLTGAGASIATGCVIGNILSGVALLSVGMVFFAAVVIAANWLATRWYLMGA